MMPVPCPPTPMAAITIWSFGPAFLAFSVLASRCSSFSQDFAGVPEGQSARSSSAASERSRNPRRDKVPRSSSMVALPKVFQSATRPSVIIALELSVTKRPGPVSLAGPARMRLYCERYRVDLRRACIGERIAMVGTCRSVCGLLSFIGYRMAVDDARQGRAAAGARFAAGLRADRGRARDRHAHRDRGRPPRPRAGDREPHALSARGLSRARRRIGFACSKIETATASRSASARSSKERG